MHSRPSLATTNTVKDRTYSWFAQQWSLCTLTQRRWEPRRTPLHRAQLDGMVALPTYTSTSTLVSKAPAGTQVSFEPTCRAEGDLLQDLFSLSRQ